MGQVEIPNQQNESVLSKVHKHSKIITAFRTLDQKLHWFYNTKNNFRDEDESVQIRFHLPIRKSPTPQKDDALRGLLKKMETTYVPWLIPGRKEWTFDLDRMKEEFQKFKEWDWCRGRIHVEPEFEIRNEDVDITDEKYYQTHIVFYIYRGTLGMKPIYATPPEIQLSLREFQLDYPDPNKAAFIMMRFGNTQAHNEIVQGIKNALSPYGISAVRADDKDWHTDLYYNVLTCLYGCGFGIAVYERIEQDDFNPNVSLEVGYSMALGKQVCLLKDKTLKGLHTDLIGKLYKSFDPQNPIGSISPELTKWMQDRKII